MFADTLRATWRTLPVRNAIHFGLVPVLCRLTERFKLTSGEARNHGSDAHRRILP